MRRLSMVGAVLIVLGANNAAVAQSTAGATLAVELTVEPAVALPGGTVTYTITMSERGDVAWTVLSMSDTARGDLTSPANPAIENSTCAVPQLVSRDAPYECSFDAVVGGYVGDIAGTFVLVGLVDGAGETLDRSAPAFVDIAGLTDLVVTKRCLQDPVVLGEGLLEYEMTVTNQGSEVALNAYLLDRVPQDTTFVSAASDRGTCDFGCPQGRPGRAIGCVGRGSSGYIFLNYVYCELGDLAPGEVATITTTLTPQTIGDFTNQASAIGWWQQPGIDGIVQQRELDETDNTQHVTTRVLAASQAVTTSTAPAAPTELPFTGFGAGALVALAMAALGGGGLLVVLRRR